MIVGGTKEELRKLDCRILIVNLLLRQKNQRIKPTKLVRKMEKLGFTSAEVRSNVWALVDMNQVTVDQDRKFALVVVPSVMHPIVGLEQLVSSSGS